MAKKKNETMSQSQLIVLAAGVSCLISVYLWFIGQQSTALFVGLWVPSLLTLGMYVRK